MKIDLTKEQFRSLALLVYMGNWVANADRREKDQDQNLLAVEQLVLSKSREFGLGDLVLPAEDGFFEAGNELEEQAESFLDEYERGYLLEDIAVQLARRDLVEKIGEAAYRDLDSEVLAARLNPLIEAYMEEFNERGVENLRLVRLRK